MTLRETVRSWRGILTEPSREFERLPKRTFEEVLSEYLRLLILSALAAGSYVFLEHVLTAAYFWAFFDVDVHAYRLLNYAFGGATAAVFFFIFAGTFLLFILSVLIRPFTRLGQVDLLQAMLYALAPSLMFGWFLPIAPGVLVWSLVLFLVGCARMRTMRKAQKGTIRERE